MIKGKEAAVVWDGLRSVILIGNDQSDKQRDWNKDKDRPVVYSMVEKSDLSRYQRSRRRSVDRSGRERPG